MTRVFKALAIALVGTLSLGATKANWMTTIRVAPDGAHMLGNPAAKVKLTEYVSYTCSHCADFHKASEPPLRMGYVQPGRVSLTVTNFVRDPIDLTAALLTNCGDPKLFFTRHHTMMYNQDKWLGKAVTLTADQRARWGTGETSARLRAIAGDLGFYEMMARHGLNRVAADRCLADKAMLDRLVAGTQAAQAKGVKGTPSFALDGEVLDGTHSWNALEPLIMARLD